MANAPNSVTPPHGVEQAAAGKPAGRAWLSIRSPFCLGAVGLVMLLATHPLMWGRPVPASWLPMAGLGLALIAWFGFRATLLVFVATLLANAAALLYAPSLLPAAGAPGWFLGIADAVLTAGELHLAWACYQYLARGARGN